MKRVRVQGDLFHGRVPEGPCHGDILLERISTPEPD